MRRMLCLGIGGVFLLVAVGCIRLDEEGQLQRHASARGFWSFLVPGSGQIMNGQPGKGALLLGLEVANWLTYLDDDEVDRNDERLYSVMGVVHLWAATDAYDVAATLNETAPFKMRVVVPGEEAANPAPQTGWIPFVFLDPVREQVTASLAYRF